MDDDDEGIESEGTGSRSSRKFEQPSRMLCPSAARRKARIRATPNQDFFALDAALNSSAVISFTVPFRIELEPTGLLRLLRSKTWSPRFGDVPQQDRELEKKLEQKPKK